MYWLIKDFFLARGEENTILLSRAFSIDFGARFLIALDFESNRRLLLETHVFEVNIEEAKNYNVRE
jgi:hypothetical protein